METKPKIKKQVVSIRLREKTVNQLKTLAEQKDRNYTELARLILEKYVENYTI